MKEALLMNNRDFLLNSSGDISFISKSEESLDRLEFNFHYATSDSLLFSFFADTHQPKTREPDMFQFNFGTYEVLNNKENRMATGDEFIRQAIRIQLETEIGTIRENYDAGSDIYKYRHMFMNKDKVIEEIKKCVTEAVAPIISNYKVDVYLQATEYFDFYNAIKISITFLDQIMWFTL